MIDIIYHDRVVYQASSEAEAADYLNKHPECIISE